MIIPLVPVRGIDEALPCPIPAPDMDSLARRDRFGGPDRLHEKDHDWVASLVHEAGHAVAARKFGYVVEWVTIDVAWLERMDYVATPTCRLRFDDPFEELVHCLACDISTGGPPPTHASWDRLAKEQQRAVDNCLIHTLAGPAADYWIAPGIYRDASIATDDGPWPESCADDFECATRLLGIFGRDAMVSAYARRAKHFVRRHWQVIGAAAAALAEKGTLRQAELYRLID
jgi:hypothetical protein